MKTTLYRMCDGFCRIGKACACDDKEKSFMLEREGLPPVYFNQDQEAEAKAAYNRAIKTDD